MPNINTAVAWAVSIASDDTHGYSQANRYGPDYDCSSFVAAALIAGGFDVPATMWTGSEYNALIQAGFITIPVNATRQKGDIFMVHVSGGSQHTLMCVDESRIVEAYGDFDGVTGDSSGNEIRVANYYDMGWQYHFRWPGGSGGRIAIWHNKTTGSYPRESYEAQDNAIMTYNVLNALGFSMNAICGILGNIGYESGYNPWRWERDEILASTDTADMQSSLHGYGVMGFTPSARYCLNSTAQGFYGFGPNFSDVSGSQNDGSAQLSYMNIDGGYISTTAYPLSYAEYKSSTLTGGQLAVVWLYNYERPGNPSATQAQREAEGDFWQQVLPYLIESKVKRKMPIWMYLKPTRRS